MSATPFANFLFDKQVYHERLQEIWQPTLKAFDRLITSFIFLTFVFCLLACIELFAFVFFFVILSPSTLLAFTLALFILTLFCYFALRLFLLSKKPEQMTRLCNQYLNRCQEELRDREGTPEYHIALASALAKFASLLEHREKRYYRFFRPLLGQQFSSRCHWRDIFHFREMLLEEAVAQHLAVVKSEPTSLEVHAALANAYVLLSGLYALPSAEDSEELYLPPVRFRNEMKARFEQIARLAMEEFKILSSYAPHDPWVHLQLAYSYRDLQMPEKEIEEYEIVLSLHPDDPTTMVKLGTLYFQQGRNAEGLEVYERLRRQSSLKAEHLIGYYGATLGSRLPSH